jgi:hypothetical protein
MRYHSISGLREKTNYIDELAYVYSPQHRSVISKQMHSHVQSSTTLCEKHNSIMDY